MIRSDIKVYEFYLSKPLERKGKGKGKVSSTRIE
jgi:hypothetical protein